MNETKGRNPVNTYIAEMSTANGKEVYLIFAEGIGDARARFYNALYARENQYEIYGVHISCVSRETFHFGGVLGVAI